MENKNITFAFTLLRYTFGLVPIVAGVDKFTNLLTHWEKYINPSIADILPFSATTFKRQKLVATSFRHGLLQLH